MKKAIVLLGACVVFTACSSDKENSTEQEKFPVVNPFVTDTVNTTEYVADIHSLKNIELRARVKGYLDAIHVDEGEYVKEGQLLFSISNKQYKEDLLKAKAMLKNAIAEAKSAELDLFNIKVLADKNVVSNVQIEKVQAKLDAANAKIDEARSDETSAELNLAFTEIRAPFDGIVNRIQYKPGSLIDEGTLLTTLSDNSEVFAYFKVSEKEYLDFLSKKDTGSNNEIELVLANNQIHKYKGKVETVEGEFDKETGNIAFRARFANPEKILKHGASGKVRLKNMLKNAMLIAQKSTFEVQEKTYVFVVDDNSEVHMKSFIPKFRLPNLYVVESGLSATDKIIYEGVQQIKEGEKITPELIQAKEMLSRLIK